MSSKHKKCYSLSISIPSHSPLYSCSLFGSKPEEEEFVYFVNLSVSLRFYLGELSFLFLSLPRVHIIFFKRIKNNLSVDNLVMNPLASEEEF